MDKRPLERSPFTKEEPKDVESSEVDFSDFQPANRKQKRLMKKGKKFLTKGGFYMNLNTEG